MQKAGAGRSGLKPADLPEIESLDSIKPSGKRPWPEDETPSDPRLVVFPLPTMHVRYFESTRSATEFAASENPVMAPLFTATAVSAAGAAPPVIR